MPTKHPHAYCKAGRIVGTALVFAGAACSKNDDVVAIYQGYPATVYCCDFATEADGGV